MPRKKKTKFKSKNTFKRILFFLIILLIGIFIIFQFLQTQNSKIAQSDSLQLDTFQPTNPPPLTFPQPEVTKSKIPTNIPHPTTAQQEVCPDHTGEKVSDTCMCGFVYIVCENNKCKDIKREQTGIPIDYGCEDVDKNRWCEPPYAIEGNGNYCLAKPIIYLYPEVPTFVDIKIESIGNVVVSNPLYPEGGWKNVLAYPNGNLFYQGKEYRELFYETDVEDFQKPTNGINIPKENIEPELKRILTLLGLNSFEKREFMDFWVPILENQGEPFIQFSLIQGKAKERIDKVIINPKPDTFIEILAYLKPLDKPYQGETLILPENPPERVGFTAVEWGGVIDRK